MSIDAILMHIGTNVTASTATVNSDQLAVAGPHCPKKISDANGYRLCPRECTSKGAGFRQPNKQQQQQHNQQQQQSAAPRPDSPSSLSVRALHQHMSAEHLLPSMQPDKAISDAELQRLGARATSCDRLRGSKHPLGKVAVASRRPPRSLKTHRGGVQRAESQDTEVVLAGRRAANAAAGQEQDALLPTLSSTNYGGMYVISSYKDNIN
jgi:hypothetical protein